MSKNMERANTQQTTMKFIVRRRRMMTMLSEASADPTNNWDV